MEDITKDDWIEILNLVEVSKDQYGEEEPYKEIVSYYNDLTVKIERKINEN